MPDTYLELAACRAAVKWPGYLQPEDFGYDFRDWVSPYSKGAHALGGIAIVLQDWSSTDALGRGLDPDVQEHGRTRGLLTNRRLETLVGRVFGLELQEVFVTNIFPFIKSGCISSPIPRRDAIRAATEFAKVELEIVRPTLTLALGRVPQSVLTAVGVQHVGLPHPAARIGDANAHEERWRAALAGRVAVQSAGKGNN